jgi:RNA polymerase sigma-70 factor (ECF subfamily)
MEIMVQDRDEWLMSQVVLGRHEALEVLVRRYAHRLLTFIRRMIDDHHRSEELFQEVFIAVWRKRGQYQMPRPFKPWLYAIALNACRAEFRRRRVVAVPIMDSDSPASAVENDPPGDVVVATESSTQVLAAVHALPPKQRAVLALRTWSEFSYGEIAEMLGCSEATVRAHMHHALAALRAYLEQRKR